MPATTVHPLSTIPISGVSTSTSSAPNPSRTLLLTRGLAAGDEESFREFHRLYFDRLYGFLLVVSLGQEQEADDALQETLLRVVRYAREFEHEPEFWCWLKAVARSAARDGGRKKRRYLNLLQRFTLRFDPPQAESNVDETKLQSALGESLEEMPPEDRRLLEQKYFEGANVRELSAAAGITEKAMESRLLRLRRDLKARLLRKIEQPRGEE